MLPSEVARNPRPPILNASDISKITKACFRKDDKLDKVDAIFLFSSAIYITKMVREIEFLLKHEISQKVIISGGKTDKFYSKRYGISESQLVMRKLNKNMHKGVKFFQEEKSTNTLENVLFSLKFLKDRNIKKILFITKTHAAGRGYLTLKKYLPDKLLLQKTYAVQYPGTSFKLQRNNWYKHKFGRERVWGEYLRIIKYGERGDILATRIKI